jgi:acetyltransferase EpsM
MKNPVLIGASPKTRLILDFLKTENRSEEIGYLIDNNPIKKGTIFYDKKVIGIFEPEENFEFYKSCTFCISLSERYFPDRLGLLDQIVHLNLDLFSIISKTSVISKSVEMDDCCIVFPRATINSFAKIGKCVTIYTDALIEHDCILHDNVEISPRASIGGGVEIHSNSFIGLGSVILPNLKIGSNVVIGAGAVLTKDVADNQVMVGNPARPINDR